MLVVLSLVVSTSASDCLERLLWNDLLCGMQNSTSSLKNITKYTCIDNNAYIVYYVMVVVSDMVIKMFHW